MLRISQSISSQSVVPATSPTSPEMQVLKTEIPRSPLHPVHQTLEGGLESGGAPVPPPPHTHDILHLTIYWLKPDFRLLQRVKIIFYRKQYFVLSKSNDTLDQIIA